MTPLMVRQGHHERNESPLTLSLSKGEPAPQGRCRSLQAAVGEAHD